MVAAVHIRDVHKRLGGRAVLDGAEMVCAGGEIAVLAGPNGAGKSTLLKIIAGVIEADMGEVEVVEAPDGADAGDDGEARVWRGRHARRRIGYVPEAADPPGHLTGDELWRLVRALRAAAPLADDIRDRLGLDALARKRIEQMSLGERRRTCVGAALIGAPRALVLDEPSNGLDVGGVAALVALLSEQRTRGVAVLVATHDADLAAAIGDRHWQLRDGVILPSEVAGVRPRD